MTEHRPPLGMEFIEQMQEHFRVCVALGTISLANAVKLYGDWLCEDVDNPNYQRDNFNSF